MSCPAASPAAGAATAYQVDSCASHGSCNQTQCAHVHCADVIAVVVITAIAITIAVAIPVVVECVC